MKKKMDAEEAIRTIARNEGVTASELRTQIQLAMLAGLSSPDPAVQARWKKVPCKDEVPTPEELIAYIATHVDAGIDPFA